MYAQFDQSHFDAQQTARLLDRFGITRTTEVRISDNPLATIWRNLQRYSGLQAARQLFPTSSDSEIIDFCNYIELADGFSAVAEDAAPIVDPVLLYYSAMWLSRALISLKLGISQSAAIKAHGARARPAESAEVLMLGGHVQFHRSGTIPSLIRALGGHECAGRTFNILDLMRLIPEMEPTLTETVGQTCYSIPVHNRENGEFIFGRHEVLFPNSADLETIASLPISVPLAARNAQIAVVMSRSVLWQSTARVDDEMGTLFVSTPNGYFAETLLSGVYIPELAVYVTILHCLSEFSRYFPRQWLQVHAEHNNDYTLIREFYTLAERKVPNLVLNELARRTYVFRHP